MSTFGSNSYSVTIASGSSLSSAINIGDNPAVAIVVPAAVTVTFQGSLDNSNFYDIYKDSGSPQEYQVACSVSGVQTLDMNQFLMPRFVKVRIGTSASPSAVSAATVVTLFTKEV